MMNTIKIALSGLMAATKKTESTANNIANLQTAGRLDGGDPVPYHAQTTQQTALTDKNGTGYGVKSGITPKAPSFVPSYAPDSPFADEKGMVGIPNVNLAEEAVNLKLAETSYKANLKVIQTASEMSETLFESFERDV